jgi:hypothetical protein
MVRGLGLGLALFVAVRKGRSMCGNPQADRAVRRRLHYLRQSGLFILFILFAENLIMRVPEELKISN